MTVTMLGRRNSGKTTFTLGMYAVLAAGFKGFSLQAGTLNEELDIANSWNHLADDSLWPPGTRASQSYRMALKDGPTPVALIDWEDSGAAPCLTCLRSLTRLGSMSVFTSQTVYMCW